MRFSDIYNERHPKKEIWISVLVQCPYRAYLKNVLPRKTEKNVYALAGLFIHEALQNELAEFYETEKKVEFELSDGWKLIGRVDFYDPLERRVIEIKTVTRRKIYLAIKRS